MDEEEEKMKKGARVLCVVRIASASRDIQLQLIIYQLTIKTVSLFLYTSLQHENSPTANSIAILTCSTVQFHSDVSIEIEWSIIKKGKNEGIACLPTKG